MVSGLTANREIGIQMSFRAEICFNSSDEQARLGISAKLRSINIVKYRRPIVVYNTMILRDHPH